MKTYRVVSQTRNVSNHIQMQIFEHSRGNETLNVLSYIKGQNYYPLLLICPDQHPIIFVSTNIESKKTLGFFYLRQGGTPVNGLTLRIVGCRVESQEHGADDAGTIPKTMKMAYFIG